MPSSSPLSKDSTTGLVAVLLITRSRPGPRLVFHYPESPLARDERTNDPDSDSETDDDEAAALFASRTPASARTTLSNVPELSRMGAIHIGTPGKASGNGMQGGEMLTGMVLGYPVESLEKVLSPGRWAEGKKFEVCLDGFTFVGHPVYAPEGEDWVVGGKEGKGKGKGNGYLGAELGGNGRHGGGSEEESEGGDITPLVGSGGREKRRNGAGEDISKAEYDFMHMPDSLDEKRRNSPIHRLLGTSMESSSTNSNTTHSTSEFLTMFQVVFVMRPEQAHSAGRIYNDLAKKLGKALHYCQKQTGYVATESRKLLAMKAKVRQQGRVSREDEVRLWERMVEGSELAWALREVFEKVSQGEVAEFRLGGMEIALHTESPPSAPTHLDPYAVDQPILPASNQPTPLTPQSALLLLVPPAQLLASLTATPSSAPLTHLLPSLTSTKSLAKLSLQLSLPLPLLLSLASHLTTWRKALALPVPLHWRNTYVVSPTAPLENLEAHMELYKGLFPTLPSLPNMLKVLSGRPIRYALLVPSRDHRGKYMEILEFLYRHGWVVQLRTFGWLYVPREMLREPAAVVEKKGLMGLEGRLREVAIMDDDDTGSVSSERTAIAWGKKGGVLAGRSKRASDATQVSFGASSSGTVRDTVTEGGVGSGDMVLVTEPAGERWLKGNLGIEFEEGEGREVVEGLVGLMDGDTAVEEFSARLGVKRARVEEIVEELEGRGWLRLVRCV